MKIKLTFLGTGNSQGVPVIGEEHPVFDSTNPKDKRSRTSALVAWEGAAFVIDCGPDFRTQMLTAKLKHIDGVLLTHEHADHTHGIDDLRSFSNINGSVPLYGQERVLKELERRFEYIFDKNKKYPGKPSITLNLIKNDPFELKGIKIIPIMVNHGMLKIFGYRFENVAYLTDVKTIDKIEKEKLKNLDTLVVNCLRITEHHAHLNLEEALQLVEELNPKRTYFTHISHLLGFHDEVEKALPENVFLAYDGLTI